MYMRLIEINFQGHSAGKNCSSKLKRLPQNCLFILPSNWYQLCSFPENLNRNLIETLGALIRLVPYSGYDQALTAYMSTHWLRQTHAASPRQISEKCGFPRSWPMWSRWTVMMTKVSVWQSAHADTNWRILKVLSSCVEVSGSGERGTIYCPNTDL